MNKHANQRNINIEFLNYKYISKDNKFKLYIYI